MFGTVDHFIMRRVMKIAHWIDRRWHINNYYVASYIVRWCQLCATGLLVVIRLDGASNWTLGFILLLYIPVLFIMNREWYQFRKAGFKWEMSPGTIPTEVYGQILAPPGIRVMGIIIGIVVTVMNEPSYFISGNFALGLLGMLVWPWNAYSAFASYFAAIPPYTGKRDPKKSLDWSFGLTPAPMRN